MDATTRATTPKKEGDNAEEGKVINDPIHGTMYFNSVMIRIIDTPEFQRLRDIKQLGGTSFVYPGGVHTRFDHSLGTCHITGVFLKYLKERNPHVSSILTDKTRMCIQIAALCHDLGQGPFSRIYQDQFLCRLKEVDWSHNENSLRFFDMICAKPRVREKFQQYGIEDADLDFIKAVIRGEPPLDDRGKRFLYEIVYNKRNGIDCDTFDKILRDCFYVGVTQGFNHRRLMESAKIVKVLNFPLMQFYPFFMCTNGPFGIVLMVQTFENGRILA